MKTLELIDRKLRDALGLRDRFGGLEQLERELARLQAEHGLDAREVAERIDREAWLVHRLGGAVTVDESFFLRHPEHFRVLEAELAPVLRAQRRPCVLWSAGCARGEEPFSMAITLSTAFGPEALRNVQIIASDVNPHALATAQRGIYGPWSFRGAGRMVRTRFFRTPGSGETFEILSPIREAVHFKHATLEAQLLELEPSSIDVIFFRNVAIYLSEAALGRVYAGMARVLREDGLLMIGPADPFPNVRELARSRVLDALVHRKRSLGRRSSRAPAAVRARPRASIRPVARSVRRTKQAAKAPCAALSRAQLLADRGLISDALLLIDAQLAQQGRNAERLALRGRIRLAAGDANGCVDDLREALSLDPSQLLLRFYYALGLEASQRTECCRSQLLELLGGLGARSDADTLGDDQATTTVGSIRKAAHELLRRVE